MEKKDILRTFFNLIDTDHIGALNQANLKGAFAKVGADNPETKAKKVLEDYDKTEADSITFAEYEAESVTRSIYYSMPCCFYMATLTD